MSLRQLGKGRPHILIVEDEAVIAMDIRMTLESLGFAVLGVASTGEDCLRKTEALRPDLVLMDINLKGDMDGIRAAREIFRLYRIPIVYLTASSDDRTIVHTSPFACLFKPFDAMDLGAAIWKHVAGAPGQVTA